jgi:hypothetical protein
VVQKNGAIEAQYADICQAARHLPVAHCIGNHDAELYKNPRATQSRFGIAQPIGSNGVMAFHGHDNLTLQAIENEDVSDDIALSFVNLVALVPLLGNIVDFAQMIADDSFEEPWSKGNTSQDKLWPAAVSPLPGWDAPWVARNDADKLVRAARGLEYVTDVALQVVLVGHTHRPGIAWANITGERSIPIVDVGSWTYGRAEIAIVTPDGVGLAGIPNV